ncbi:helix-turn-helix domain-containing protein [Streptomyces sp. ME19-01-6]|uniref:AraC-like ligand-binding domain-containing protein n=1 Tax=Streptomyces sp. ME19-01-6 TaxID=3028686 RepID=UPI0029BF8541|nr:helix-turn-helix domain-containing protein [Streptomyces sp. ME19-01-6]MDX3224636.1 helix-turn-helix domain-containing protein [Streptomyces sp. ME19-01-6]
MDIATMTTAWLTPGERFGWWHDMTASTLIPTAMGSDRAADFEASARVLDLGDVQVSDMAYPTLTVTRTPRLIRRGDPGYVQLSLTLSGNMGLSHFGRQALLGSGDLAVYSSSEPFDGWATPEGAAPVRQLLLHLPRAALPLTARQVDHIAATRIPGGEGFATLLVQFLTHIARNPHQFGPQDAARLSTTLIDLLSHTIAQRLDALSALPPESRERALLLRVQSFIRRHLPDPGLTPAAVAAAHHISPRSLHRLFQRHGLTVASWIRHQRLERCRRDLADPRLATRPIQAIAAKWGFSRPGDFTRAFRGAYGMSPSEYRHTPIAY